MVNISRKTNERNGIETIVDNDGILWLNEKHRRYIHVKENIDMNQRNKSIEFL